MGLASGLNFDLSSLSAPMGASSMLGLNYGWIAASNRAAKQAQLFSGFSAPIGPRGLGATAIVGAASHLGSASKAASLSAAIVGAASHFDAASKAASLSAAIVGAASHFDAASRAASLSAAIVGAASHFDAASQAASLSTSVITAAGRSATLGGQLGVINGMLATPKNSLWGIVGTSRTVDLLTRSVGREWPSFQQNVLHPSLTTVSTKTPKGHSPERVVVEEVECCGLCEKPLTHLASKLRISDKGVLQNLIKRVCLGCLRDAMSAPEQHRTAILTLYAELASEQSPPEPPCKSRHLRLVRSNDDDDGKNRS